MEDLELRHAWVPECAELVVAAYGVGEWFMDVPQYGSFPNARPSQGDAVPRVEAPHCHCTQV